MNPVTPADIPSHSYSTIFHCDEDFFTCFLRFVEGAVSVGMFILFVRGYRIMTAQNNNPISKEDKHIFMLAMAQTFILALYYFLFEQFFILATIRNLFVWISINALELLCKINWISSDESMRKITWAVNGLKVVNFLMWFVIAVGHGSQIENTNYNLGYNCRLIDWTVLSGVLLIITAFEGFVAFQIIDRNNWELKQPDAAADKLTYEKKKGVNEQILLLVCGSVGGAFIMFVWDYLAFSISETEQHCAELFSGNTFFRKILCFLLKIISMQVVPCIIYYNNFYKRKEQFSATHITAQELIDADYLNDDAYSDLNRTLTSRSNSRLSLLSGRMGSTANL